MTSHEEFEAWWDEFMSNHEDWKYADSEALRFQAWQAALATAPAWHDAPTSPGLWLNNMTDLMVRIGDSYDMEHIAKFEIPSRRWYGPIPMEKEA